MRARTRGLGRWIDEVRLFLRRGFNPEAGRCVRCLISNSRGEYLAYVQHHEASTMDFQSSFPWTVPLKQLHSTY